MLVCCGVIAVTMASVLIMRVRVIVFGCVDMAVLFHRHRLLSVRLLPDALAWGSIVLFLMLKKR